jgi:PAS domain S-box-containing protein
MKRFSLPLRVSIPATLFLWGSVVGIGSFQREVNLSYARAEEEVAHEVDFFAAQTSNILEYLSRRNDFEEAESAIGQLDQDLDLRLVLLFDETDRVLLSTRDELRSRSVLETPAASGQPHFQNIRDRESRQVQLSEDKQSLVAMYPVRLGPSKVGILWIDHNLSNRKQEAYEQAWSQSLFFCGSLTLLSVLVWLFFQQVLMKRVQRLVETSDNFARGNFSDRANLMGSDELAQLSAAFDRMADKLQAHTESLQKNEQQFRSLVANIPGVVYRCACDRDWTMEFISQEIETISGYPAADFIGNRVRSFASIIHPEDVDLVDKTVSQGVENCQPYAIEYRVVRADRSICWVYEKGQSVFDDRGQLACLDGAIFDISERVETEVALRKSQERLQRAKEDAEAASLAKSQFLANMSHELRTPLNASLGMAQLLLAESVFSSKYREDLQVIYQSGEYLLSLINDILEMTKIEAGKMILHETNCQLRQLLSDLMKMMQVRAEAKGLQLILQCSEDVPEWIKTDELRLRQMLLNLVGNAIKFTDRGCVTLRVHVSPQSSVDALQLQFDVEDTGAGIKSEDLDKIFEAFYQTNDERKLTDGTGLGLTIVQSFVKLMGGQITVRSQLDLGTCFSVTIPIDVSSTNAGTNPSQEALSPTQPSSEHAADRMLKILVAEDNRVNQKVVLRMLSQLGYSADLVENGLEVLNALKKQHYDLIFMDLQMPEMGGLEATQRIFQEWDATERPIVIALTANALSEDRDRCLAVGMSEHIGKPLRLNILKSVLERYDNVDS